MGTYSVAEAKNQLSDLIERAIRGEGVVITRHGHPVVELRSIERSGRAVSCGDLDWLAAHRVAIAPTADDAAALMTKIRDDDER